MKECQQNKCGRLGGNGGSGRLGGNGGSGRLGGYEYIGKSVGDKLLQLVKYVKELSTCVDKYVEKKTCR